MEVGRMLDQINNFLLQKDAHVASIELHVFLLEARQVQGHNQIMEMFIFVSKAAFSKMPFLTHANNTKTNQ